MSDSPRSWEDPDDRGRAGPPSDDDTRAIDRSEDTRTFERPTDETLIVTFEISGRISDGGVLKLRTRLNAGGKLDVEA